MSNPHPGLSGPLALLCLTGFYTPDMNWPLPVAHYIAGRIFRIKDSLSRHEMGRTGAQNITFGKELFSEMVCNLFLMQDNIMCSSKKRARRKGLWGLLLDDS